MGLRLAVVFSWGHMEGKHCLFVLKRLILTDRNCTVLKTIKPSCLRSIDSPTVNVGLSCDEPVSWTVAANKLTLMANQL